MIKLTFLVTFVFTISFFCSCGEDSCDEIFDTNVSEIDNYLEQNGLEAQTTASGLRYIIDNPGEGTERPDLNDVVTAAYKGFLLNGTVFDESTSGIAFPLLNVIGGWQEGIPLFGKNGSGTIFIPSYLGYGTVGAGPGSGIGPNEVLIFEVEVLDF